MKKLAVIIILNWNGWEDTVACIESCRNLNYADFRIVVVDNGSSDGSVKHLRERFPGLDMVQTGQNLGFAGGNNAGIRFALELGAEYIWLLNNDTIVDANALTAMIDALEQHGDVSIGVSKIYYFDKPEIIWFAGGTWTPAQYYAIHRGLDEEDTGQYSSPVESDFATGCSLLFKVGLIAEIGYLREDYFLYWEDLDWSIAARARGGKILYIPESEVWHKVSRSTENYSFVQNYYYFRSGLLFYSRHAPGAIFRFAAIHLVYAVNQYFHGMKNRLPGYAAGLKDFVLRRFGRREGLQ